MFCITSRVARRTARGFCYIREGFIEAAVARDLRHEFLLRHVCGLFNGRRRVLPQLDLQVATTADNLVRAVNFATRSLDEPVYFLIAEREQLREFLMKHYPVPEHLAQFANHLGGPTP